MKFTYKWLQELANVSGDANLIADKLTNLGLELEEITDFSKTYSQFVVALVEEVNPHPDATKLNVCQVFDGKNKLQVVCGAANVRAGLKVAFAPIGAQIPANQMIIKKAKIRGVESQGMICSGGELCLSADTEGIMELDDNAAVGTNFADYYRLNDVVIDLAITPNRGDCANVLGIARELNAVNLAKLLPLPVLNIKATGETKTQIKIEDRQSCHHFYLREVKNIKPLSQYKHYHYLKMINEEHENPLVNISNYVNFTYGRPNHIYDADKISGDIIIRKSKEGESFVALGGDEHSLPAGLTIVADNEKVLAIAGVIGGELSKVDEASKNILIEVAHFDEKVVANAGRKLNIHTESRYRFERGIDKSNADFCIDFITNEIINCCGGEVKEINKAITQEYKSRSLNFSFSLIEKVTGIDLANQEITAILTALGFIVDPTKSNDIYNIRIPAHRNDIEIPEDIVEEVIRIKGLNAIKSQPLPHFLYTESFLEQSFLDKAQEILKAKGYDETICWSFNSAQDNKALIDDNSTIIIANPISEEMAVMRSSMLPNLLKAAKRNADRSIKDIALFELGFIYGNHLKNRQQQRISGIKLGKEIGRNAHESERDADFFDIKALVYQILNIVLSDLSKLKIERSKNKQYHPWQSAALFLGNKMIAEFGKLNPIYCKKYDFKAVNLLAFEIIADNLPNVIKNKKKAYLPSIYQPVNRDFAFYIDEDLPIGDILNKIKKLDTLVQQVKLFDIYTTAQSKSVAFNMKLQATDRTLSEQEINDVSQKVINLMVQEYKAKLRDNV